MKSKGKYFVYLLRCKDKTLYCGIAKDPVKRLAMHNLGNGSTYVRSRGGGKIVYTEQLRNKSLALKREATIKKLSRSEKLKLIRFVVV
jgi:putative endonuclease